MGGGVRPRIDTPERNCQNHACGKVIVRTYAEGATRYAQRRFCGRTCSATAQRRRGASRHQKRRYRNSSPLVARMIRELRFVGKLKHRELSHMFSLAESTVSRICSGQVWQ